MKAEAIIFDKDGTLLDFDTFWVGVSQKAIAQVLKELGREDIAVSEILRAVGVEDGVSDITGILCQGTYGEAGQAIHGILAQHGCTESVDSVVRLVTQAYEQNADGGEVLPTCPHLKEVLTTLKNKNIKLAVVTTDNDVVTRKCLDKLGITHLFDKIYTDDGVMPTKPEPYCAQDFCLRMAVDQDNLIMVGDTMTDVNFARNAGIKVVCVAKTEKNKGILAPFADVLVPDVSHLLQMID